MHNSVAHESTPDSGLWPNDPFVRTVLVRMEGSESLLDLHNKLIEGSDLLLLPL